MVNFDFNRRGLSGATLPFIAVSVVVIIIVVLLYPPALWALLAIMSALPTCLNAVLTMIVTLRSGTAQLNKSGNDKSQDQ